MMRTNFVYSFTAFLVCVFLLLTTERVLANELPHLRSPEAGANILHAVRRKDTATLAVLPPRRRPSRRRRNHP